MCCSLNALKVIVLTTKLWRGGGRRRLRCWRKHNIPENLRFSGYIISGIQHSFYNALPFWEQLDCLGYLIALRTSSMKNLEFCGLLWRFYLNVLSSLVLLLSGQIQAARWLILSLDTPATPATLVTPVTLSSLGFMDTLPPQPRLTPELDQSVMAIASYWQHYVNYVN